MPFFGSRYSALTHHRFWDGSRHYWTGMAVEGMGDQDPDNPHCCPDLSIYDGGEVQLGRPELGALRAALKRSGMTHRAAGERLGMGLSRVRQRLYGRRPFTRVHFNQLCRLTGVDPAGMTPGDDASSEEAPR